MATIHWSASATERVVECPASAVLPAIYQPSGEAANLGTALHTYFRDTVLLGRQAALAKVPLSAPHRLTCEGFALSFEPGCTMECEVSYAYHLVTGKARFLGKDLNRKYGKLAPGEIAGTADLLVTYEDGTVYVADYKTGHYQVEAQGNMQLLLLGLSIARAKNLETIEVGIVQVDPQGYHEERSVHLCKATLHQAERLFRETWQKIQNAQEIIEAGWAPEVHPGSWCRFCPCQNACPAYIGLAREFAVGSPLDAIADRIATFTPEQKGKAWLKMKQVEELLETVKAQLKSACDHDGFFPLPDGSELRPVRVERESIDASLAEEVLIDRKLSGSIKASVTKADLEREVLRQGGSHQDTLTTLDRLRQAGAVRKTSYTSYVPTRKAG